MTDFKPAELILVYLLLQQGFVAALNCTSQSPESLFEALERELFPKKLVRPVKSFSDPTYVRIKMSVYGILKLEEKSQTMTSFIWLDLTWQIVGLSWDEKECGTKRVSVPRENIWIPDMHISEFTDEDTSPYTPYVFLYNTGQVDDDKPVRVVSSCRLGIYSFPFDVQNCTLTFGSFIHLDTDIRMIQGDTSAEALQNSKEIIETRGEWELIDIRVAENNLTFAEGSYSEVKYSITLRRRPMLYVVNLIIPSGFLISVDLFSFLLPPHSVDRSSFKMTLILGYTVFLLLMNDLLPVTGETTPLISVFFSISLALMVASLLETIFITNVQFSSSHYNEVPHWLCVLVLRYLAVLVGLPPKKKSNRITVSLQPHNIESTTTTSTIMETSMKRLQSISGDLLGVKPAADPQQFLLDELKVLRKDLRAIRLHIDNHFQGTDTCNEWYMIGIVIDRMLFGIYIVFITISFITIICIWIWS